MINTIASVAQEIYEELGEQSDTSIAAIAAWVRRNIGGLANMLGKSFEIKDNNYEIHPNLSDIEKYIFKKMYSIYYFDLKIKSTASITATDYVSIKDDFGSIQKINSNEVLRNFYSIRKQEYEELKSLIDTYNLNAVNPLQIVGDDTVEGRYNSEFYLKNRNLYGN